MTFFFSIRDTPNMIWISLFSLFITISYVLGHLFYRRGPKKPDRKSFVKNAKILVAKKEFDKAFKDIPNGVNIKYLYLAMQMKLKSWAARIRFFFAPRENMTDLMGYRDFLKKELACTSEQECEFPYPNLKDYLGNRGHCHLCSFVTWKNGKQAFNRSKTYINLLKIRLKNHYPQKCSVIIRNEAHVRLASSSWYVSYALRVCSLLGGLLIIFAFAMSNFVIFPTQDIQNSYVLATFIPFAIPTIIIFLMGEYIRTRIEHFIHYQRLREVFYVLETAYTAFSDEHELLNPPFMEYRPKDNLTCNDRDCEYYERNFAIEA